MLDGCTIVGSNGSIPTRPEAISTANELTKLLTGKPKDEVLPVELFLCGDCGEVLNDLLPPGLKIEEEA